MTDQTIQPVKIDRLNLFIEKPEQIPTVVPKNSIVFVEDAPDAKNPSGAVVVDLGMKTPKLFTPKAITTYPLGGIPAGTDLTNKSFEEILNMALCKELNPTLVAPSTSAVLSKSGFAEIGDIIPSMSFTSTFSRGAITPAYGTSGFRSGLPNKHTFTGEQIVGDEVTTTLAVAKTITGHQVVSGNNTWTAKVSYDAGEQPKGSAGTPFSSPLPAGTTSVATKSFVGVYPILATIVSITEVTKLPLVANTNGVQVIVDMVAEDNVANERQVIAVPATMRALTKAEQWDDETNNWLAIDMSYFVATDTTYDINSNAQAVPYKDYTNSTGAFYGARRIRFTF